MPIHRRRWPRPSPARSCRHKPAGQVGCTSRYLGDRPATNGSAQSCNVHQEEEIAERGIRRQRLSSRPSAFVMALWCGMAKRFRSRRLWELLMMSSTAKSKKTRPGCERPAACGHQESPLVSRSYRDRLGWISFLAQGGGNSADLKPCSQPRQVNLCLNLNQPWGQFFTVPLSKGQRFSRESLDIIFWRKT